LQKVLRLANRPRTIEGVDIAHTAGTETVAAVVQFIDGLPFKPGYRRMKIHGVDGPDDTASIHEAVARRFRHVQEECETPPDILLIDGGRGQLNAALAALAALGISSQTVVALAKREELVYVQAADEPLHLSRHAYSLRLLQYVRDEAHRFAQHYHHLLRKKSQLGQ
jgi:excinuclease ABC subunit C